MGVKVRSATAEDFDELAALCVRAYAPSGLPTKHSYYTKLRDVADRAENAGLLVATDFGRVVGTVTYCPKGSPYREIAGADEGEFRMLAVHPEEQGHGVGAVLVKACIERARDEGFTAVVLSSAAWMRAAHSIYDKLGFVRTPERDWSPMEGVDLLTYRLSL